MTTVEPPHPIEVALASLVDLGVEWWRLNSWANQGEGEKGRSNVIVRRVARKMGEFLAGTGIEIMDMTGRPYVTGLAVEVLDTVTDDGQVPEDEWVIAETVSPIVLWQERVVRPGLVVIQRRTQNPDASGSGGRAHE